MSRFSMNPVVRLKQLAAHFMLVIEFCHRCGVRMPLVWRAPDPLWAEVGSEWGVLCPKCFDELARRKGLGVLLWEPREYPR